MKTKYRFWSFIAEVLSWKYKRDIKRETLIDGEKEARDCLFFKTSREFWNYEIGIVYSENCHIEKDETFISTVVETKVSKDAEVFEKLKNKYKFYKFFDLDDRRARGNSISIPYEPKGIKDQNFKHLINARQMYSDNSQIVKKAKREYERSIYPITIEMLYARADRYIVRNIDIFMWFVENVFKVHGDNFIITNMDAGWHKDDHIIIERV